LLKRIKAIYVCDSCLGEEERSFCGNEDGKHWAVLHAEIDDIGEIIKNESPQGWIKNDAGHMWCDKCHMKRPLAQSK